MKNMPLLLIIALVQTIWLGSCSKQESDKREVYIGLAHSQNHSFTKALKRFEKAIESNTNGKYDLKIYHSAQLGGEKAMQEMLTIGSLDICLSGVVNTYEPLFSVFELPYLFEDRSHVMRVNESAIMQKVADRIKDRGLHLIGFYENGFRHLTNSKRRIQNPADADGLLIRTPENPAQIATIKALGAIPTPMDFAEVYTALLQGVIDGQENPLQNIWYGRFYEAQPYLTMTKHIYNSVYVLASDTFWSTLSAFERKKFVATLRESTQWQLQFMADQDRELEQKMKEKGVEIERPDLLPFQLAVQPAYDDLYLKLGPEAEQMVRSIRNLAVQETTDTIFYLNSYHIGYPSSDAIEKAIRLELIDKRVHLETFYLDSKIRKGVLLRERVTKALEAIQKTNPDVIIVSDDNAVEKVVVPHLKGGDTPVVFCGVNWTAEPYGLPDTNITGMLEVLPIMPVIDTMLRYFPYARRVAILNESSVSANKDEARLVNFFRKANLKTRSYQAKDFEEWKMQYAAAKQWADLIYFPTNGAIAGWDEAEALQYIEQVGYKPIFTCDDFMMPFAVIGITKVAAEQGEWAAQQALKILRKEVLDPAGLQSNRRWEYWYNPRWSDSLKVTLSDSLIAKAKIFKPTMQVHEH